MYIYKHKESNFLLVLKLISQGKSEKENGKKEQATKQNFKV